MNIGKYRPLNNRLHSILHRKYLNISLIYWLYFILIVFIWVILQFDAYRIHQFPLTRGETDGIYYMRSAEGPIFHLDAFHGPGYPLGIRIIRLISGFSLFSSAKITSIISGLIFLFSSWVLLSTLHKENQLPLLIIILAFTPAIIARSNMILSDMMGAAFFISVLVILLAPDQPNLLHFALSGFIAGCAYLTRYIYVILVCLPIFVVIINKSGFTIKGKLCKITIFFLVYLMTILPWSIFVFLQKGSPFWNLNHLNIAFNIYREGMGWNVFPTEEQFPDLSSVFISSPKSFLRSWWESFARLPLQTMNLFGIIGSFVSVGFFIWLTNVSNRKKVLLIIFAILLLTTSLVWFEDRFVLPIIPFFVSFIVSGIFIIPEKKIVIFSNSRLKNFNIHLRSITVIIVITILLFNIKTYTNYFGDQAEEYRSAINWLIGQPNIENSYILSSKPHIPFFAGAKEISFRNVSLQTTDTSDFKTVLQQVKPDYLVFDERYGAVEFSQLLVLLNSESQPFKDVLVSVYETSQPMKLIVYKYIGN